jgi:hypothetical protein
MKLEIIVPENLSEIPLKFYQSYISEVKDEENEDTINQKLLEHFCGLKLKDIVNVKRKDLINTAIHFDTIFKAKREFKTTFKIGNVEFGFIPNLEDISQGEYVDLENYLKDISTLHRAMAVLYRPITKRLKDKYEIEPYKGSNTYAEVMEFAPLDVCLEAQVFFWNLGIELLTAIPNYLEKELKKMKIKDWEILAQQHNLQSNGDGIFQSLNSLKETLEDSMKSLNYHYINV